MSGPEEPALGCDAPGCGFGHGSHPTGLCAMHRKVQPASDRRTMCGHCGWHDGHSPECSSHGSFVDPKGRGEGRAIDFAYLRKSDAAALAVPPANPVATARAELDQAIVGARDAALINEGAQKRFRAALDAYCRLVAPGQGDG